MSYQSLIDIDLTSNVVVDPIRLSVEPNSFPNSRRFATVKINDDTYDLSCPLSGEIPDTYAKKTDLSGYATYDDILDKALKEDTDSILSSAKAKIDLATCELFRNVSSTIVLHLNDDFLTDGNVRSALTPIIQGSTEYSGNDRNTIKYFYANLLAGGLPIKREDAELMIDYMTTFISSFLRDTTNLSNDISSKLNLDDLNGYVKKDELDALELRLEYLQSIIGQ